MTQPALDFASLFSTSDTVVKRVVLSIALACDDRHDPTLSKNKQDQRMDVITAALRYYRTVCLVDACTRIIEAYDHPDNDMTMEGVVALLGHHAVTELPKNTDVLKNLYEVLRDDKSKQASA